MEKEVKLFKALADSSRLKILSSLVESPKYVELLAERLELSASTVSFHLKKLEEAGLVEKRKEQYYIIYSVKSGILNTPLSDLIGAGAVQEEEDLREAAYCQKIIDTFFKFEKLKSIPVQRKKRLVVLEKILEAFQTDRIYTEKEVNLNIADFHDDFAALRRAMIEEGLMKRENGNYQRIK